jgi:H+/Cl- antiporter ClcA
MAPCQPGFAARARSSRHLSAAGRLRSANFALIEAFPAWQNAWGLAWIMVSFAVLSLVAIGFVFRFVPETKGHSVEEVVQIFEEQAEAGKAHV